MNTSALLRILIPGGVLNHHDLEEIIKLAKKFNVNDVQFGLRQDVNLLVDRSLINEIKEELEKNNFDYDFNTDWSRNIVTSYVSNRIYKSESWLTEGAFLDILDTFNFKPELRINICDPNQGLVPLLTGNLNFIASKTSNYWYLKIELPKWFKTETTWPTLIYSDDISKISKNIEEIYNTGDKYTIDELFEKVNKLFSDSSIKADIETSFPNVQLPFYEGFNRKGEGYWLGIYKRNYLFSVDFLDAASKLCYSTQINKICLTPWRSVLIKNIKKSDRFKWIKLLGKHGINMRHSSLDLNWRVPDFDEESINLKRHIISEFDKHEVRTYGLTFAIQTKKVDLDGMVMIKKRPSKSVFKSKKNVTYNIYHTKDFEVNQKEYDVFKRDIPFQDLSKVLKKLTIKFYEQQNLLSDENTPKKVSKKQKTVTIYSCKHCLTTYDQEYGDSTNVINAGTPFNKIADTFRCPVCDAPKTDFEPIEVEKNLI